MAYLFLQEKTKRMLKPAQMRKNIHFPNAFQKGEAQLISPKNFCKVN